MKVCGCSKCGAPVNYWGNAKHPHVLCNSCKSVNYSYATLPDGTLVCFTHSNIKIPEDRIHDLEHEVKHLKRRLGKVAKK